MGEELEIDLEAVLEFLRKNGLSESERALMDDLNDKSHHLASSDSGFEKFVFPMVPPLRIPVTKKLPEFSDGGSSKGSSDDEFVSLGSSTTELYSSDFTNPYGIRTTRPTSQASSDRLSQFGTARDNPDFDMQNDLFWYKEKDEDYAMPPLFVERDFDGDPSEDKFITTVQAGDDQLMYNFLTEGSTNFEHEEPYKECYELGKSSDAKRVGSINNTDDFDILKRDSEPSKNDKHDFMGAGVIAGESQNTEVVRDDEGGDISDELLMYDNEGDDYEIFSLRIIHRKNRTGFEENKELPIVMNSIIAGRYCVTEFLGSAAFSRVVQAHDLCTGMDVCLKIIKNDKDFFDQSLDEIKLLKFVNKHDPADIRHILRLYDYFYHQEHLFIVTELLRANLYEFQKYNQESEAEPYFTMDRLQAITRQCLEALSYLHDLGVIHCDLKPENILIKSYRKCEIKIIDLGSSCFQNDKLSLYVQSRSYRAPEVMLGLPYDQKIDLWSIGCILAELCSGEVLFPNESVVTLIARMIAMLGPIDVDMLQKGQDTHKYFTNEYDLYNIDEGTNQLEYIIPEESSLEHHLQISDSVFIDFLKYLLEVNPKRRPTAKEALEHPWFSHSYNI